MAKQLLTHSRMDAFKTCRKKHWFNYEQRLRPVEDAKALRMGSAFHAGVEALGKGLSVADACEASRSCYGECPAFLTQYDWEIEQETIMRLVCCYEWRWSTMPLEYVAVEEVFSLPLLNPKTGRRSPHFDLGGKTDAIVRLEDNRLAVKETKLFGEDLGPDAPMWRRIRMDHQVTLYLKAARRRGYDCQTVLYDVARKPSIAPTQVPILDELGCKIVLDRQGDRVKTERKQWRQTGDAERGYTLQTRPMTAWEWGEKLSADIVERPDFYFARREIPRLDHDVEEYESELWDIQQVIRDAQKNSRHYRTVNKNTCGYCSLFGPCTSGWKPGDSVPEGFEIVSELHPELKTEETNVDRNTTQTPAVEAVSATASKPEYGESYW